MTVAPRDARHLTFSTLDQLWGNGAPVEIPIRGNPASQLQLDPKHGTMTLVTVYETPEPDVAKLKNIRFGTASTDDEELAELTIQVEGNVHGSYGLLATIADELQIEKLPLAAAVAVGVARYRNVLVSRGALTVERELGLFGELLFLDFLIHQIGAEPAVAAWQGPMFEEHDFTFSYVHIEVKTTRSERRKHTINGLDQLVPVRDVPLRLLSIQLTRSSPDDGRTLSQIVKQVQTITGGHRVAVDAMLDAAGWRAEDADLYTTFWAPRSVPRAYAVAGDFPAITPWLIAPIVPNFGLISEVSYKVDLTTLDYNALPEPIGGFVETKEH